MRKYLSIITGILLSVLFIGCKAGEGTMKVSLPEKEMVVGTDIVFDDINDFYYTEENINYDAYYQRYRFYAEDGKHLFFHETRERKDDYGPCTEEDTTQTGTIELTDDQWSRFCDLVNEGKVKAREESDETGGPGPWLYLYWTNDESKYQQFSFASYGVEKDFEEYCLTLAPEESAISGTWISASMGYEYYGISQPEYYVQFTDSEIKYLHMKEEEFVLDHSDKIILLEEISSGKYKIQAETANGSQYTYQTAESDEDTLQYYDTWNEEEFPEMYRGGASLSRSSRN